MQKYLEILKECALFEGIEEGDLLRMLHCTIRAGASLERYVLHYLHFAILLYRSSSERESMSITQKRLRRNHKTIRKEQGTRWQKN